jgi:hypothetical protein
LQLSNISLQQNNILKKKKKKEKLRIKKRVVRVANSSSPDIVGLTEF